MQLTVIGETLGTQKMRRKEQEGEEKNQTRDPVEEKIKMKSQSAELFVPLIGFKVIGSNVHFNLVTQNHQLLATLRREILLESL